MSEVDSTNRGRLARCYRSPLGYGLAGGLLYWAALPWAGSALLSKTLWPLGWIAPVWWVLLVLREKLVDNGKANADSGTAEQGRLRRFFARPYVQLWLAGFVFWLATIHWLRLPHPATYLGWIALSFYLGFYLPVFVAVSRVAVHRLHVPAIVVTPIVWTGLEYVRAYMITGFLMVALGHTQYPWIALLQISDIFGGYGVSFLMMFVAACVAQTLPRFSREGQESKSIAWWPLIPAAAALILTLAYGYWQLSDTNKTPGPKIALIQGSIDSEIKQDPTSSSRIYTHYNEWTDKALEAAPDVDLIVWPETMYRFPDTHHQLIWLDPGMRLASPENERIRQEQLAGLRATAARFGKPLLLGISTVVPPKSATDRAHPYNSAIHVTEGGDVVARYDKMHRVLFGEYIPFSDWIPALGRLTPLPSTVDAGERGVAFDYGDFRISPSICYETVLPQVIRRQVFDTTFVLPKHDPDILVNVTNDGWFWGSSQLDQHLICGVFRAIEMRMPLLIAANTGFSASIDSDGRILAQGPRRAPGYIIAEPQIDGRTSLYLLVGDWFAGLCLLVTTIFAAIGGIVTFRGRQRAA